MSLKIRKRLTTQFGNNSLHFVAKKVCIRKSNSVEYIANTDAVNMNKTTAKPKNTASVLT